MLEVEIILDKYYDRPSCDCCEGFWLEYYKVLVDGEEIPTNGTLYSLEDAKAALFDYLLKGDYLSSFMQYKELQAIEV